jgi:hypothetical protein
VALQQSTRELWAQQGPFEPYTIHGVPQQNIPEIYIKGAVWNAQANPPRYVAQSSAPEESGTGTWFPVDFNEEHICWVEVRLQEPAGSEAYWQAFRIAGQDLGLDITQGDVETHLQDTTLHSYRESIASSHSSRASTPSVASVIRPRPSPYQPGSRDQEIAHSLAESLNINDPMSNTLTVEVPAGTINPVTCYVFLTYYCAHNGLPLGPSLYFVIHSYHAQTMTHTPPIADLQTMTHTPPSDDSVLILRLVVLVACDSD